MKFSNIDTFQPSSCINGQVSRLNRHIANVFRKHLLPYHITDSQLSILFILSKHKTLTQKELTDITILEKSSLNRNIKRLIESSYVSQTHLPQLKITSKGLRFVDKIIPVWRKAMKEVTEILEEDGKNGLQTALNKFNPK